MLASGAEPVVRQNLDLENGDKDNACQRSGARRPPEPRSGKLLRTCAAGILAGELHRFRNVDKDRQCFLMDEQVVPG
jgi:hypothetical protein